MEHDLRAMALMFKALGEKSRLQIVALISHDELTVGQIQAATRLPQSTVSRHLSTLRSAGILEATREGTHVHYAIASMPNLGCKNQLQRLVSTFSKRNDLRQQVERARRHRRSVS